MKPSRRGCVKNTRSSHILEHPYAVTAVMMNVSVLMKTTKSGSSNVLRAVIKFLLGAWGLSDHCCCNMAAALHQSVKKYSALVKP
jgi:hypothetical protein